MLLLRTTAGGRWIAQWLVMGRAGGVGYVAGRVPKEAKLKIVYEMLMKMLQCGD